MVRVLQVLEATEGGTLTHLRDLVLGLDPAEFEQTVAVGLNRGPGAESTLDRFRERGIEVVDGPLVRWPNPRADWQALAWLRGIMAGGGYHLVHCHSSKAGFLGRLAAHLQGLPAVYTPNGWAFLNPEFAPGRQRLIARLERLAARWGRRILPVSEGEAAAALQWGITTPDRLSTVRNGIDLTALDRLVPLTRAELGLSADTLVAVTIGRRVAQKGDSFLLDAWDELLKVVPDAVLLLVGDGPLEAGLRRQAEELGIADQVRFVGRVEAAPRYLPLADLFVLPSLFEGCPYALMEAMALGLACVATQVTGSLELVAHGQTGLLVPPGDEAALAQALLALAENAEARATLGQAAWQWARAELDVRRMVADVAGVYRRVLTESAEPTPN